MNQCFYVYSDKFQSACVQMGRLNHVACIELLLNGFSRVSNCTVAGMHCVGQNGCEMLSKGNCDTLRSVTNMWSDGRVIAGMIAITLTFLSSKIFEVCH